MQLPLSRRNPAHDVQPVGVHPGTTGRGYQKRGIQHGNGSSQEQPFGVLAEDRHVLFQQRADHAHSFRVQPLAVQHGHAHQEESQRGYGVDEHGEERVVVHDAHPAAGASGPVRVVAFGPSESGIAFFQAPVGVGDQLGGSHADDAEGGKRRGQRLQPGAALGQTEPPQKIAPAQAELRVRLQGHHVANRHERKQHHQHGGRVLHHAVTTAEKQQHGDDRYQGGPVLVVPGGRLQ